MNKTVIISTVIITAMFLISSIVPVSALETRKVMLVGKAPITLARSKQTLMLEIQ